MLVHIFPNNNKSSKVNDVELHDLTKVLDEYNPPSILIINRRNIEIYWLRNFWR